MGGLLFPHSIEMGAAGAPQRQKIQMDKIELDAAIDDARFKMPPVPKVEEVKPDAPKAEPAAPKAEPAAPKTEPAAPKAEPSAPKTEAKPAEKKG